MPKKKLIFVYPAMMVGGSTTSMLSILNGLDYNKYEVDLLLNSHTGELLSLIPKQVNLLPPAWKYTDRKRRYLHRLVSPEYMYHYLVSKHIARKTGVPMRAAQYMEMKDLELYREIEDEYDVAVSFLEGDVCKFTARHVKAKKKITWIHINYIDAKFDPKYDESILYMFSKIVLVSKECKKAFDISFPMLATKTLVIENILSKKILERRANEKCDIFINDLMINLITVCRVTFESKGLDRAVDVFARLKNEGHLSNVVWYIVGDGGDMDSLRKMISVNHLDDYIKLFGMQTNPYPYLKNMSMFFLPSRREGKPMVVTEAFMMGLPALVTEYSSAREQVRDGIDGIIVENSEDGIYEGLKRVIEHPEIIPELKKNVVNTDYSNVEEIKKVEQLLDE